MNIYKISSIIVSALFFTLFSTPCYSQELSEELIQQNDVILFTPPAGWKSAEISTLSPSVKAMVVGKGEREYPPSINLTTEAYAGTLKDYLKIIKTINKKSGSEWKDLGTIRTEAGNASLSQADSKTEWGDIRMMHVILLKNEVIYILTATALKDEFPKFYKDFFESMRSIRFEN